MPVGTIVEQDGQQFRITGYDANGNPQGEPVTQTPTSGGYRYLLKGLNPFGKD